METSEGSGDRDDLECDRVIEIVIRIVIRVV
jgi:hypothetical protein